MTAQTTPIYAAPSGTASATLGVDLWSIAVGVHAHLAQRQRQRLQTPFSPSSNLGMGTFFPSTPVSTLPTHTGTGRAHLSIPRHGRAVVLLNLHSCEDIMRVCSVHGCPTLYDGTLSRCPAHRSQADRARGTSRDRGYNTPGHRAFRSAVLTRDPICVLCRVAVSTVADHWPRSRKELIELGMDPNDPQFGRGLDADCHNRETARHQQGGWNAR